MISKEIYHEWLGIRIDSDPPDHYRLLGLERFESNLESIRNAAEDRMSNVRKRSRGEFEDVGEELLNDIAAAKLCLIDSDRRAEYDAKLKRTGKPTTPNLILPDLSSASIQQLVTHPLDPTNKVLVGMDPDNAIRFQAEKTAIGVSRIHCVLKRVDDRLTIKDLESTNGTFINRKKIPPMQSVVVQRADLIMLGRNVRLRIPDQLWTERQLRTRVLFVGRHAANDIQLDHTSVSTFHARIIHNQKGIEIEDLGSTNGTVVRLQSGEAREVPTGQTLSLTGVQRIVVGDLNLTIDSITE